MENPTKALLLVAGVLLAILIISLGMMIFNMSSSTEDAMSGLDTLEIQQFNSKYEMYEGIHSGKMVKTVLGYAIDHNQSLNSGLQNQNAIDVSLNIKSNHSDILAGETGAMLDGLTTRSYGVKNPTNIIKIRNKVKTSKEYKIWYEYNDYGMIWTIHIDKPYE